MLASGQLLSHPSCSSCPLLPHTDTVTADSRLPSRLTCAASMHCTHGTLDASTAPCVAEAAERALRAPRQHYVRLWAQHQDGRLACLYHNAPHMLTTWHGAAQPSPPHRAVSAAVSAEMIFMRSVPRCEKRALPGGRHALYLQSAARLTSTSERVRSYMKAQVSLYRTSEVSSVHRFAGNSQWEATEGSLCRRETGGWMAVSMRQAPERRRTTPTRQRRLLIPSERRPGGVLSMKRTTRIGQVSVV